MTDTTNDKARLRWQCRRGMLELDIMLSSFFDKAYDDLTPPEQAAWQALLKEADADLFAWLMGHQDAPEAHREMISKIQGVNRQVCG